MKRKYGFTLVEILVVIVIIAMLLAIILSVLSRSRQAAYRIKCLNNLKQLGIATMAYTQSYGFYPFCVPPDVNEKWSDFLADKAVATDKELGVPVSLWPFHQTAALYDCPVLSGIDCDISYCYNWFAGKKFIDIAVVASVIPSYIPPKPAEEKTHYELLSPEKVKSPDAFVLLYDLPLKPPQAQTAPDSYDPYNDIDPDDYENVHRDSDKNPDQGFLWYYDSWQADGPHSAGDDILFADGHTKWFEKWPGSSITRSAN
jgi:prepilin-type N-terminal cleavage/methylation domain-containing protein